MDEAEERRKSETEEGLSLREADARARSKLAIERTYAAWVRTGVTLVVVGIALAEFLVGQNDPLRPHFSLLGLLFVFAGLLVSVFALYDYYRAKERLHDMEYELPKRWILTLTSIVAGLTILLVALFVYRTFLM